MKNKILTGLFFALLAGTVACDMYNQPHTMTLSAEVISIEWRDAWLQDWVIDNDEAREALVKIEITATGLDKSKSISFDLTIDGETKTINDAQFFIISGETKTFSMIFDTGVYMDRPISSTWSIDNLAYKSVYRD